MAMKVRDLLGLLHEDGWFVVAQKGDIQSLNHGPKPGKITIAGGPDVDVLSHFLHSHLKQDGLKGQEGQP